MAKKQETPVLDNALVKVPTVPTELVAMETERSKPQSLVCSVEKQLLPMVLSLLLCGDRFSIYRSCPLTLNIIAIMESENLWPARDQSGEREWRRGMLLVDEEMQLWSIGAVGAINRIKTVIAVSGGKLPTPATFSFKLVEVPGVGNAIRCTYSPKRSPESENKVPETVDHSNARGEYSSDAAGIPF